MPLLRYQSHRSIMADQEPLLHSPRVSSHSCLATDVEASPELHSNASSRARGHNAEMERSFSTRAAMGLGFRYVCQPQCV